MSVRKVRDRGNGRREAPLAVTGRIYHNRSRFTNDPSEDKATASMTDTGDLWALGLMSGTSLDGIDAALIRGDGRARVDPGPRLTVAYDDAFRARLRAAFGARDEGDSAVASVERELTLRHADAVGRLLAEADMRPGAVAVVGFHGHTILHQPEAGRTRQIGDGALLAAETGIDVVCDFRARDVAGGGQGAPLAPLYHAALAADLAKPLAVLNLGGVGNLTWIGSGLGSGTGPDADEILAFDTGPGNALIDDWAARHTGRPVDTDGALARAGRIDEAALAALLDHPYFDRPPPKSLDRDAFDPAPVERLSPADGAATLTAFSAAAVARARDRLPAPPRRWLVTGGGRRNPVLMAALAERLEAPVAPVEAVGWDGDALEAQAFAYLALRSLEGLALSLPGTTGVARPMPGGVVHRAPAG
jgi:anhydro-N-acetylmuramic acid kinase